MPKPEAKRFTPVEEEDVENVLVSRGLLKKQLNNGYRYLCLTHTWRPVT